MSKRSASMGAIIIMLILSASPIQAQEPEIPQRLTLEDAVRLAVSRNPSLLAAKNEIQALEGDAVAAGKRPNPAFSLEMEDYPIGASGSIFQQPGDDSSN